MVTENTMAAPKDTGDVIVTQVDNALHILLNRPEVNNAFSSSMRDRLYAAIQQCEQDKSIKAVLISGSGDHFCSGGDVKAMASNDANTAQQRLHRMRTFHPLIIGLAQLEIPIIAAVNGAAYGAGFGLALLADVVIASEDARFCMAFQRLGLAPDFGASYTLPRIVGLQHAKEIMLSGRIIDANEAMKLGITLETLKNKDALMARALEITHALSNASSLALGITKRLLQHSLESTLPQMLEMESTAQAVAATSSYARNAFQRFADKEKLLYRWPEKSNNSK